MGISSVGGGGVEVAVAATQLAGVVEGEGTGTLAMGRWDRKALDMAEKVLQVLGLNA